MTGWMTHFDANPGVAKKIIDKRVARGAAGAEAARKARGDGPQRRAPPAAGLPGNIADCSDRDPANTELFIVEGDSRPVARRNRDATGNSRRSLPIRGKLITSRRARLDKVLQNNEIRTMITAVARASVTARVRARSNLEKLRYHKVIIMTDADVDGSHIRSYC